LNRTALASLLITAAAAIAACGGDDDGNGAGGDGAEGSPTAQVTAIPPDPLPTVEGRVVNSIAKGYTVTYPEGWEPRYDIAVTPQQKIDTYFAPARADGGFRASISIACEQSTGEDSRAYYERKRAVTEGSADGPITGPEQFSIGAVPAFRIEYELDAGGQEVRKIDVYAANDRCGYTIAFAAAPEEVAQYLPAWDAFLAALTLS
jgi:hypothetical protein